MSRIAKWKLEKVKLKVVFRLQFHATHIPQTGWDKLFISFIPADSGKVTAKTSKANVRNGTCKWADPIYETTRLLQDIKTKQYDGKLYKLVVAMGSSRSGLLGEANINLADYADSSKPSTVALLLHGCTYGTVLHVTVQLLTSKTGFREFEQQRELRERGLHMATNNHEEPVDKFLASSDMINDQIDKANVRVRFKTEARELPSLEEEVELNEDYADSAVGIDDSSNTSESLYAEKHDSGTHEIDSLKSTISGDLGGHSLNQSLTDKADTSDHQLLTQRSSDWVHGWSSDYSMDNELATASEENIKLRGSLELAESSITELKLEVSSLQGHADELGAETQKFSQLLVAEIALGEELTKEIFVLKAECSKFKDDLEQLKHPRVNSFTQLHLFQDLQIKWLQGFLILEEKVREVQKKACLRYHDRDIDSLYPDLEALHHLLQDLKQGITQTMTVLNVQVGDGAIVKEMGAMIVQESEKFVPGNGLEGIDADQYYCEDIVHGLRKHGQVTQEPGPIVATIALEGKISELQQELEESKTERNSLTRKLDQMECYYEALIQELEENQKHMLGELQNLRNEHSTCLFAISSCKNEMEKVHEDMNEQLLRFAEERHQLESLNKELEGRAIVSETALARARWNYSIAVDQLQKDLQLLSFQVLSMFETSENLVRKTFVDSSEFQEPLEENSEAANSCLRKECASFLQKQYRIKAQENEVKFSESQKIEQELASEKVVSFPNFMPQREVNEMHPDLVEARKDFDVSDSFICQKASMVCTNSKFNSHSADSDIKHLAHQSHNAELKEQLFGGEIHLDDLRGFFHLQEELYQKFEHELYEMHEANIHLDVFSRALLETLHESRFGIKQMKEEMDQLAQRLAHAVESKEFLMVRLQDALDDVNTQMESKAHCIAKCNELALANQVIEKNFQSMFDENCFLNQKVKEYECLLIEYENIESKYDACMAEKTELLNSFKQETSEKCSLQDAVKSVNEELNALKADFDKQSVVKKNLEKTVVTLRDKLGALWSAVLNEEINEPSSFSIPMQQGMEEKNLISAVSQFEELLQKTYEKILQLTQKIKNVEEQRDIAQQSLSSKGSETLFMKKKYESEIQDMVAKIDISNALVEKLQRELENIASKFMISCEAEGRYAEQSKEVASRLAFLEVELQNTTHDNRDLAQKILDLEAVNEELERTKLTVFSSIQQNQDLMMYLQAGNEESAHLEKELWGMKETLQSTRDELHSERSLRSRLEGVVADLSFQLNVKNDQLLSFGKEKAELVHLKQLVLDLELEKKKMCDLLLHSEECLIKANENTSTLHAEATDLQTHLVMLHEYVVAADVELICTRNQLQSRMQELVQQLESLDRCYRELHLKHLDVLTTLNGRISTEAQYVEENAKLLTVLNSLRSELETTVTEKNYLVDRNNCFLAEIELYKTKAEISNVQDKHLHELETEQLKHMLLNCEELIDNLWSSRDEHEITVIVLTGKLNEQLNQILLLEEYAIELQMLRNQNNELARRLSEQTLKTEEFKNLSVHLRELKDKADAECLLARERREAEAPSTAIQESLRMAFVREQCETKVQELRNQLYISKKHGEEMLLKLQDALDEVENRKKSEASHKRKNEELSLKILDLESELQMVLADKREKIKACDEMKAELECSLLSLDCCKEEKQKLEDFLQECIEERTKVSIELSIMKEQLESSRSPTVTQTEGSFKQCILESLSINKPLIQDSCEERDPCLLSLQDSIASKSVVEISSQAFMDKEDIRQLGLMNEHFTVQSLRTSMGHLHEELEKMKNENLASHPQDANYVDPTFQGLQREVLQLNKANEQLGSIFPSFSEFSRSGNALERVLALEIELAEALQGKKKSNIHFQSSFLKQHNDEEAVFQSFRDINELIKDMLELKGRYAAVESELKEMHDRYSELSLQFAEVEGERQKLMMTLKNSRTPKKSLSLYRPTSAALEDHS